MKLQCNKSCSDCPQQQLTLTAEGRALIDQGIEARSRWLEDLTTTLPPEQQANIVTALVDLTAAARSLDPSLES